MFWAQGIKNFAAKYILSALFAKVCDANSTEPGKWIKRNKQKIKKKYSYRKN